MCKVFQVVGKMVFGAGALLLVAVAGTSAIAQEADSSLEGFRELRVAPGLAVADDFIDVVLPFLRGHPESEEGNAGLEMKVHKADYGFQVDIIQTGFLDDSVSGHHYRGSVIRTGNGQWELLTMHIKPICARGQNVDGYCKEGVQKAPPAMFIMPEANSGTPLHCVNVAADDVLNVRKGPSSRFAVVGALAPGNCSVAVSETCEGSWCRISSGNVSGWVHTGYLYAAN
ncbi:SH3 domain-containing protein [Roseibium sp.]|uniref:SH3 domain-containing protein n=1 Tax=Roseibium sp. TaxID=1936156 RepID=UPI003A984BDE